MHLQPSFGKGRAVGTAIISSMFKNDQNGRIPVVAVTGTNGKTTTVRLIAHLLTSKGLCVGMTNTDGVYVGGQCIDTGDCSGPKSACNVLFHPDVDAAVLETARGGVLREGLAFDRCDVAVVTNVGSGDHLGLNYITTVQDLAVLKRVIVQNVAPTGVAVLNAADPNVAEMASKCQGAVTFFALDKFHPVMATHRARGQSVVYVENGFIVAVKGTFRETIALADIPLTMGGRLVQAVQAMPATRRTVVISGAGDRRDQDIRQQTEILGDAFDSVILYEDQCQRGRQDGEVVALLRQGLANAKRTTHCLEIKGEFLAIDTAMDALIPGELCLILVDQVQEAMAHIAKRVNGANGVHNA